MKEKLNFHLMAIAELLKTLGENQRQWEREQIRWQKGVFPYNDFLYYIALSTVWQTFSRDIEGEKRKNFVDDVYNTFKEVVAGRDFNVIEDVLRAYKASRFMAGVHLLRLWERVVKKLEERKEGFDNPLVIQNIAVQCASRTQHWLVYAPLEAAIVVGELFIPFREIIPALGSRVMHALGLLGLKFGYPPIKREVEIIHQFLLYLADLSNTNHLIIDMGLWRMGVKV